MSTSKQKRFSLSNIAIFFLYLSCIALSIKSMREPDIWWMYRTGEWMITTVLLRLVIPSRTFLGTEWINVKWLFEILITFNRWLWGPEGIFIIQAIVSCFVLFLQLKHLNELSMYVILLL